jgi:hypothetical protein
MDDLIAEHNRLSREIHDLDYEEDVDPSPESWRTYKALRQMLADELAIIDDKINWEEIGW